MSLDFWRSKPSRNRALPERRLLALIVAPDGESPLVHATLTLDPGVTTGPLGPFVATGREHVTVTLPAEIQAPWGFRLDFDAEGYQTETVFGLTPTAEEPTVQVGFVHLRPRGLPRLFPPEAGPLQVHGTWFEDEAGQPWSWRGYTWFHAFLRFRDGEDLTPDLRWLLVTGVNVVRVLGRVEWPWDPVWGATRFVHPEREAGYYADLARFFDLLADHGLRCEFVPLTYPTHSVADDIPYVQGCYEVARGRWNVLIEASNEPGRNSIAVLDVMRHVDRMGVLSSYGIYEGFADSDVDRPHLDYVTMHTMRDGAWPRKARHAQEVQVALGVPVVNDEPMGMAEFDRPGARSSHAEEFVWYMTLSALYGPGATLHSDAGLVGRTPREDEPVQLAIAGAVADVWRKTGTIWQTGIYAPSHVHFSPVDFVHDVWTYASIVGDKALAVRIALSAPQPINGWRTEARWGPAGSIVLLTQG